MKLETNLYLFFSLKKSILFAKIRYFQRILNIWIYRKGIVLNVLQCFLSGIGTIWYFIDIDYLFIYFCLFGSMWCLILGKLWLSIRNYEYNTYIEDCANNSFIKKEKNLSKKERKKERYRNKAPCSLYISINTIYQCLVLLYIYTHTSHISNYHLCWASEHRQVAMIAPSTQCITIFFPDTTSYHHGLDWCTHRGFGICSWNIFKD